MSSEIVLSSKSEYEEIDLYSIASSTEGQHQNHKPRTTDRFGFPALDGHSKHKSIRTLKLIFNRKKTELEREKKWIYMLQHWKIFYDTLNFTPRNKLKDRIRKGIPDTVRGAVWSKLINSKEIRSKIPNYFQSSECLMERDRPITPITIEEVHNSHSSHFTVNQHPTCTD